MAFRNEVRALARLRDVAGAAAATDGEALVRVASKWQPAVAGSISGMVSTADLTLYLDQAAGDDGNDGLTAGTALATWAAIEARLPRFIDHLYTVRIVGGYTGNITVSGRFVRQRSGLIVRGDTAAAASHVVTGGVELMNCCANGPDGIQLQHVEVTDQIGVGGSIGVMILQCRPRSAGAGVRVNSSIASVYDCDFGAGLVQDCIYVSNSRVASGGGIGHTGTGTRWGLFCNDAGVIGKFGAQPGGTTANEAVSTGGVIR